MLTSEEILAIAIIVVVAIGLVALMFWVIRRLRRRKAELLHELKDRPDLVSDRAFNRLAMARREGTILQQQGIDLGSVRDTMAQSQAALDQRQFERAYELAQSAHEAMVGLRLRATPGGRAPVPTATSSPPTAPPSAPLAASAAAPPAPPSAPLPRTPPPEPAQIPKNRAESQFQIHLLADELAKARSDPGRASQAAAASATYDQARSAFDRGDFTDAFRLALRGRRQAGGGVESLAPSPHAPPEAPPSPSNGGGSGSTDPLRTAERVAGSERCASCGYPATSDDAFCRGCGAPRTPSTCPQCGAPRAPKDAFCGRCGARFT